jgi:hypothetical protein
MSKTPQKKADVTRRITAALKRSAQQARRRARVYGTTRLLVPVSS